MSELIFLDLEWNTTFYRNRKGERLPFHELIEVAAIKVEAGTGAMLDSFHSYVHPKASRKIDSRTYRLLPYAKAELNQLYWGVGIDEDIIKSSIEALCVAVNKLGQVQQAGQCRDERLNEIMNYIQEHYLTVTLDELTEKMHLSKPYLSKYIREKSGKTFGDIVKNVRMKRARTLLKNTSMTVENIAESVGYQNVEHFNRLFKRRYGMTPVQFRNSRQQEK